MSERIERRIMGKVMSFAPVGGSVHRDGTGFQVDADAGGGAGGADRVRSGTEKRFAAEEEDAGAVAVMDFRGFCRVAVGGSGGGR